MLRSQAASRFDPPSTPFLRMSQLGGGARPDMPRAEHARGGSANRWPSDQRRPEGATAFCGPGGGNTKPVMARSAMTATTRR
jgi:hypothetical protein